MKRGIDVSDNQGVIDWSQVKAAGTEFAIIRSTRGSGKTDYQFLNNVKGCQENDIPFDVYKYVYALTPEAAAEEIAKVCELLLANGIFCTIWYDIEYEKLRELGKAAITEIVKAAEAKVQEYGLPFGIYCNKDWYENVINSSAFDNDFWIARYPSGGTKTFGDAPAENEVPAMVFQTLFGWQWSSEGYVVGISGAVDLDIIYQDDAAADTGEAAIQNPYAEPVYTLYRGRLAMREEYVKWLQWYLVQYGFMASTYTLNGKAFDSVDGKYGALTDLAVGNYQKAHPETYSTKKPDKKVGPKTRAALKAGK